MTTDTPQREAEYKRDWINQHDKADEIVVDAATKEIVGAVYYYAPTAHRAEQQRFWKMLAARMELEKIESENMTMEQVSSAAHICAVVAYKLEEQSDES